MGTKSGVWVVDGRKDGLEYDSWEDLGRVRWKKRYSQLSMSWLNICTLARNEELGKCAVKKQYLPIPCCGQTNLETALWAWVISGQKLEIFTGYGLVKIRTVSFHGQNLDGPVSIVGLLGKNCTMDTLYGVWEVESQNSFFLSCKE